MPVQGFAHYNIRVDRPLMEVLRAFYTDVVGLCAGPRPAFESFGYWLYAGEQDVLHLSERLAHEPHRESRSTLDHIALACIDWPWHQARLQRAGLAYTLDHVPGSGRLQVFCQDPAGHGIELTFPPGSTAGVMP
ncbi:MAG: diguanylate cyclase [Proteobacteria bacterium]|nr:diguanylate cyclase [Pseudomonadota bacterium]